MEVSQLFNIILLTLSIATILLTLVSYALYKVRQVAEAAKVPQSRHKLNGAFFKRYVPYEITSQIVKPAQASGRTARVPIFRSVAVFFVILALVIFCALTSQLYFKNYSFYKRGLEAKQVLSLENRGLLKTYDFVPIPIKDMLTEVLPAKSEGELSRLLRGKVAVFAPRNSRAAEAWRKFFDKEKLELRTVQHIDEMARGEIAIIPEQDDLSQQERGAIQAAHDKGVALIASGPIGAKEDGRWAEKIFGVSFKPNQDPKSYLPLMFLNGVAPFWKIPAGLLLEWLPLDNRFSATATSGVSSAVVSNYQGVPNGFTAIQLNQDPKARSAWLSVDPIELRDATAAERVYAEHALEDILTWVLKVPQASPAPWPKDAKVAVGFSVDSEDAFENVDQLTATFKNRGVPATFFVVSNLFRNHPESLVNSAPLLQIESHSENHELFEGQVEQQQFDRIQLSRLEIEEFSQDRVRGFHPPEERFDASTVAAAIQNHLDYFYGDSRFFRFAPTQIADGKILYFSRVAFDDFNIQRRHDLGSAADIIRVLFGDYERARLVRGEYLLNMHTQIFGSSLYREILPQLIARIQAEKEAYFATFRELTHWYLGRQAIDVKVERSGDISVESKAQDTLHDVVIYLDRGKSVEPEKLQLPEINPGQRLELHPEGP